MEIFSGTADEFFSSRKKYIKKKKVVKKKYPYLTFPQQNVFKDTQNKTDKKEVIVKGINKVDNIKKAIKTVAIKTKQIDKKAKVSKTYKGVKKAIKGEYARTKTGVRKVAAKAFDEDPREVRANKKAAIQQKKVAKSVSVEEQLYMKQVRAAQVEAQKLAHKKEMYLASLDEEEALEILEATHPDVGTTEVGEDGTLYDNKFNRKLAYKELYWKALEYRNRFNEMPVDWDKRKLEQERRQMDRQRADTRRNNLLRAHRMNVSINLNGPAKAGQILDAPNVFSRNNPNNVNVFDERGKQTILDAPNVFDSDREDVKRFNPLHAERLFGTKSANSNIFGKNNPYHQHMNQSIKKQPNILHAQHIFGGSNNQLNFGKVGNGSSSSISPYNTPKIKKIKQMKPKKPKKTKFNLWGKK